MLRSSNVGKFAQPAATGNRFGGITRGISTWTNRIANGLDVVSRIPVLGTVVSPIAAPLSGVLHATSGITGAVSKLAEARANNKSIGFKSAFES